MTKQRFTDELVMVANRNKQEREYWLSRFQDFPGPVSYPPDRKNAATGQTQTADYSLHPDTTAALLRLSKGADPALHVILTALTAMLLGRVADCDDVAVGTPIYRQKQGEDSHYINTSLPIRLRLANGATFKHILGQTKQAVLEGIRHYSYPMEILQGQVAEANAIDNAPLFGVGVTLGNIQNPDHLGDHTGLVLKFQRQEEAIGLTIAFDNQRYSEEAIDRLEGLFDTLAQNACRQPDQQVFGLDILPSQEKQALLTSFNDTNAAYDRGQTIHALFRRQADTSPDAVAIKEPDLNRQFTYAELDRLSDHAAYYLVGRGFTTGDIAALSAQPGLRMMASILGVLKAGGAYLPLDPRFPGARQEFMIRDAGARVHLDADDPQLFDQPPVPLPPAPGPDGAVYIIYTSGTTGRPKGVRLRHQNLVNYTHWFATTAKVGPNDHTMLVSSFAFDLGYTAVYSALLRGAVLHLPALDALTEPERLLGYIRDFTVTYLKMTPSLFNMLLTAGDFKGAAERSVRLLVLGGEGINVEDVRRVMEQCPGIRFMNHYGPTEATIGCIAQFIEPDQFDNYRQRPTIGRPIFNNQAFILDREGNPLPVGVPGELCVGGDGLASGYLNRPEATHEKFTVNSATGTRIYRTGDRARWTNDGAIEFLGRIDLQVKIRGYRVETGEIENQLLRLPPVGDAVVLFRQEDPDAAYLAAYVAPAPGSGQEDLSPQALRDALAPHLPDYMIPSYFIALDSIPLTPNGKVDRRALPAPQPDYGAGDQRPKSRLEERLAILWSGVLKADPEAIGPNANFFAVGGQSLKATILASRIHKEFQVKLPLTDIFRFPTLEAMCRKIEASGNVEFSDIQPVETADVYPCSAAQRRLFVLQRFNPQSTVYNSPRLFFFNRRIPQDQCREVAEALIQRHDSLRTSFVLVDGHPMQRVATSVEFRPELHVAVGAEENGRHEIQAIVASFVRPFDLASAPLLRIALMESGERTAIVMDMHHIISDGVSQRILERDFTHLLEDRPLPPLRIQYKDYAVWQNSEQHLQSLARQEQFWLEQFQGEIPVLELPLDVPRPRTQDFSGSTLNFDIEPSLFNPLEKFAKDHDTTLFIALFSVFQLLLSKLSSQEDIVTGIPLAGRRHTDLEDIIGMFVNTLAVRCRPRRELAFDQFVRQTTGHLLLCFENQDFQFDDLVDRVAATRDTSRNPLFDVMFLLQNTREVKESPIPGPATGVPGNAGFQNDVSRFDMTWIFNEAPDRIHGSIEYSTALFQESSIRRFIDYFKRAMAAALRAPGQTLHEIDLMDGEERHRVLIEWNRCPEDFPRQQTVHGLFIEQARRLPDAVAVITEELSLSYGELDRQSDLLAARLTGKGLRPDEPVAIKTGRNCAMAIGVLGILKAGGGYLPINKDYPDERISYILNDSRAVLLITDEPNGSPSDIILPPLKPLRGNDAAIDSQTPGTPAGSLCYIIYTSGSTGVPKGVMVDHQNVVRLVQNTNFTTFPQGRRLLQTGALEFDASTFEIWGSLLNRMTLCLAPKDDILSAPRLKRLLRHWDIGVMWMTVALFNQMLQEDIDLFKGLRHLLVGGDALSPFHINKLREAQPELLITNGYGPTENTTFTCTMPIHQDYVHNIPIGGPIHHSTVYILDNRMRPQPIGVPGELYTGGAGVARGYLNNPEATDSVFIDNPFVAADRLYRTGDLARWLPDGTVEFLGRSDFQVKIRGFRIEPGEIENRLLDIDGVEDAVVVTLERDNRDKYLSAYIVSHNTHTAALLREALANRLPDYMIPSFFTEMESIPLTANGKVDRRALPVPDVSDQAGLRQRPADPLEKKLVDIWSAILAIPSDDLGTGDNFFSLGGHSLKAITLLNHVHKEFQVQVPLHILFQFPTIQGLANHIRGSEIHRFFSIPLVEDRQYYPLSPAQKRMFILHAMQPDITHYNVPFVVEITGPLDRQRVEEVFAALIQRHEGLRTSFFTVDGQPVQQIHPKVDFAMEYRDGGDVDRQIADFIQPFDLERAPLLRVALTRLDPTHYILMADMHHIVTDGGSLDILRNEFSQLYNQQELNPPRLRYRDVAVWQNSGTYRSGIQRQERFWLDLFEENPDALSLPYDFPRPLVQSFAGDQVDFQLQPLELDGLKALADQKGCTMFMVTLSCFAILLSKLSGQQTIVTGTPVAGRGHADLQSLVGMFVNTLALPLDVQGDLPYETFLEALKERVVSCFDNQDLQFEDLVDRLDVPRDTGRNPLFDITFSYGRGNEEAVESPGLTITPYAPNGTSAKFDLSLFGREGGNGLYFSMVYCTRLFKRETVETMASKFQTVAAAVVSNPAISIGDIDIVTEAEREMLLRTFNDTARHFNEPPDIIAAFNENTGARPHAIALVDGDQFLTYGALDAGAKNLAIRLRGQGLIKGTVAAIVMEAEFDLFIAIMAVLMNGAAFVPIAPDLPENRVRFMLEDSDAKVELRAPLPPPQPPTTGEATDQFQIIDPEDPAYIIYTSGSTGQPKGVVVPHRGLMNLSLLYKHSFALTWRDKASKYAGISFDASIFEVFPFIAAGASITMVPPDIRLDPAAIQSFFSTYNITHAFLPTQFAQQYSKEYDNPSLRWLIAGGDRLQQFHSRSYRFINGYGPTENSVMSTFHEVTQAEDNIPIGKPVSNCRVYILDRQQRLAPPGTPGELCIAGDSLASGYLNRPERTAESFIPNPFGNGHLYRSGDLARWTAEGTLQFLGRIDSQIKIRGFRIEIGEIEALLTTAPGIKDCFVTAPFSADGERYLCAYVVMEPDCTLETVRRHLADQLPSYMIPQYFIPLEQFPLNSSGKVDRRALPLPSLDNDALTPPASPLEEAILAIWADILNFDAASISTDADFFKIGGHSLRATVMVNRLRRDLGGEITLTDVFQTPTIKGLAAIMARRVQARETAVEPVEKQEYYPLSPAQKRMYILQHMDRGSTVYNIPQTIPLAEDTDIPRVQETFRRLIQRHDILRTAFITVDDQPVQQVRDMVPFDLSRIDSMDRTFVRPFQLDRPPLMRGAVAADHDGRLQLLLDMHHIISDGLSMEILFREFTALFRGESLPEPRVQYKDYAVWQHQPPQRERAQRHLEWWSRRFAGELPVLNLPLDNPRPSTFSFAGSKIPFKLDNFLSRTCRELAERQGVTLFMLLHAVFNLLLSRLGGQEDIICGTPVAGRHSADLEDVLGMFVNTLALRHQVNGDLSFSDFLNKVKQEILAAFDHQELQFEDLVDHLKLDRNVGRQPLFDVMMTLDKGEPVSDGDSGNVSRFDMTWSFLEGKEVIGGSVEYSTALFNQESVRRFITYFQRILEAAVSAPGIRLQDIELLDEAEKSLILKEWNACPVDFPRQQSVHSLFMEQARTAPDLTAIVTPELSLSYGELDRQSGRVAAWLLERGLRTDEPVAIMTGRNSAMVIGVLGILKAGGGYLPINKEYPDERIAYLLQDSGAGFFICDEVVESSSPAGALANLHLDPLAPPAAGPGQPDLPDVPSGSLCYIIYTSGSTGIPKGVMVDHINVTRLVTNTNFTEFPTGRHLLQTGALEFDASTFEIWGSLLNRMTLCLAPKEDILSAQQLKGWLRRWDIGVMWMTVALFNQMLQEDIELFNGLRHLLVGGDALSPFHINKLREAQPDLLITNGYGPTENTTFTCTMPIHRDYTHNIPIGGPIHHTTVYILDKQMRPQPIGVPGELYTGGCGVGRGYLNNPESTAAVFIDNPFVPGDRLYRTGDLARWLPDGTVEFLGRLDFQVKIRGFRIEPGEIENRLLDIDGVEDAVVLTLERDNRDKYLSAYIVSHHTHTAATLREALAGSLPDYMIPSFFTEMESIPLTANGKVDRRALPVPDATAGDIITPPANETEEALLAIFASILELDAAAIGTEADFFQLGGHSLKATVLMNRVQRQLQVEIPLTEIFRLPTVKLLAEFIQTSVKQRQAAVRPIEKKDYYPLSAAQKRMYILQQLDPRNTVYNIPLNFRLTEEADIASWERALQALIRRHDSLRTRFITVDDQPAQRILDDVAFKLEEADAQHFVRPFDLSRPPLLRGAVHRSSDGHTWMLLDMHHIISDGVSLEILIREFTALRHGETLESLALQYKDFAEWQHELQSQGAFRRHIEYWQAQFDGEIPVLSLPTDFPRPPITRFDGATTHFQLDEADSQWIADIASQSGATEFMVLGALFSILLARLSGQEDLVFGTPVAGRTHADLEGIIGMFVNTLAIRTAPMGTKTFGEFLTEVRNVTLAALDHQELQFEELVDHLHVERDPGRHPLFDVMLSLQNQRGESGDGVEDKPFFASQVSRFDLNWRFRRVGRRLACAVEYSTCLFKNDTILRFVDFFKRITGTLRADSTLCLNAIDMMPPQETELILHRFNDTQFEYPRERSLHRLTASQLGKEPDAAVLVCGHHTLTRGELYGRAARLARELKRRGVGRRSLVGLMSGRSPDMVIGILAILAAGGAYVPIEPEFPADRIQYMVADTAMRLLLTDGAVAADHLACDVLPINTPLPESAPDSAPSVDNQPHDPVYIIYTSGTTGRPKGTVVKNSSVVNLVSYQQQFFRHNSGDRVLQFSTFCFDASVEQIFMTLFSSAVLVMVTKEIILDSNQFHRYIATRDVTHIHAVPSFLETLTDIRRWSLKRVVAGGDVCSPALAGRWSRHYEFVNKYGPTETTVTSIETRVSPEDCQAPAIPVGRPVGNTQLYILDRYQRPVPMGVTGELHIAGDGVAHGYLNKPELTHERFVHNHITGSGRMYKTGDLCRWRQDGMVEFLGRLDHQVKIRGFRIELGEIHARLLQCDGVKEAVVKAVSDAAGGKFIAAYMILSQTDATAVRRQLSSLLPGYMIPQYLIPMDSFPRTASGKVNQRLLPPPDTAGHKEEIVPPANALERELRDIWAEILTLEEHSVSVDTSFFDLGGHSLRATILANRVQRRLQTVLPLQEVFRSPTIRGMAAFIAQARIQAAAAIEAKEKRDYYPLSSQQERLFILQQLNPNSTVYNMPQTIPLPQGVTAPQLESVFSALIQRHDSLRTSFHMLDRDPVQRVHAAVDFQFQDPATDFVRPFDLSLPPLLRAAIIETNGAPSQMLVDMHHIISDGSSMALLRREFQTLAAGGELQPLAIQYKDFALWQRSPASHVRIQRQEAYWLHHLEGELPVLQLPYDFPRPETQSFAGASLGIRLSSSESEAFHALCAQHDTTLFMTLTAILSILLAKLSRQQDIIVGFPVAGRQHPDLESVIGMLVNTLPLRSFPRPDTSVDDFFRQLKETAIQALDNQDYPLEVMVEKLQPQRDISRNPLFDVMMVLQNQEDYPPSQSPANVNDETEELIVSSHNVSRFDMTWGAVERQGRVTIQIEYTTALFKADTIRRFLDYFRGVARQLHTPGLAVKQVEIISPAEKREILEIFNTVETNPVPTSSICAQFQRQAEKHPHRSAIIFKDHTITYSRVDTLTTAVAAKLAGDGLTANSLAVVMMERSIELTIAIMSVLKAGAAYVPIDPALPQSRKQLILEDCNAPCVITELDLPALPAPSPANMSRFPIQVSANDAAYLIFTSGSTGRPKGAVLPQKAAFNTLRQTQGLTPLLAGDRMLLKTNITFDVSVIELFFWFFGEGAQVILPPGDEKDPLAIMETAARQRVTHINFVPSMLSAFLEFVTPQEVRRLSSIQYIAVGGEAFLPSLARQLQDAGLWEGIRVENVYGPSETAIYATTYNVGNYQDTPRVSIGVPLKGTHNYIMDEGMNHCPVNVPGELMIGGLGVGCGYLNQPELTHRSFIPDPHVPGGRMYRSGDLCAWLDNGEIDFFGRIDHQVKIRGFRIELGEIESCLRLHPDVREALVMARPARTGDQRLVAYYVPRSLEQPPPEQSLSQHLQNKLPFYMTPDAFVAIDEFPTTTSGKLDRKNLPEPPDEQPQTFIPPQGEMECSLAQIWADILSLPISEISADSDFFKQGGHSLKAAHLLARIRNHLGITPPLVDLFEYTTLRAQARHFSAFVTDSGDHHDNLLLLKAGEVQSPELFLFHEVSGQTDAYAELSRQTRALTPFYGVTATPLPGLDPQDLSIEELAAGYVDALVHHHDSGPFYLAGHSLGGTIAFEAASQLEKKGFEVALLAMLDSPSPDQARGSEHEPFTPAGEIRFISKFIPKPETTLGIETSTPIANIWTALKDYLLRQQTAPATIQAAIKKQGAVFLPDYENPTIEELLTLLNTARSLRVARARYTPRESIKAPVVFFQPQQTKSPTAPQSWQQFCESAVTVVPVPGDHTTMLQSPHVQILATALDKLLPSAPKS